MTEKANVRLYKSNAKTFGDEDWRYCRKPDSLDRYLLDYRIVLNRTGGLCTSEWSHNQGPNGLSKSAAGLLNDLQTIAQNLGYNTHSWEHAGHYRWGTHVKNEFHFTDNTRHESLVLFEVKAFKNGNLHLKLNQRFIAKLNVEFGRLKGWVKSASEAASELDIPIQQAEVFFNSNLQLKGDDVLKLEFNAAS